MKSYSFVKVTYFLASIAASFYVAYNYAFLVIENSTLISVVVTSFSVMAAFLVTSITLLASSEIKRKPEAAATDFLKLRNIKGNISAALQLMHCYLLAIALGIILSAAYFSPKYIVPPSNFYKLITYAEHVFTFVVTFSILDSFTLPAHLINIYTNHQRKLLEQDLLPIFKSILKDISNPPAP